jgi:hypothetical protein
MALRKGHIYRPGLQESGSQYEAGRGSLATSGTSNIREAQAMAEHSINFGHCIQFQDTSILGMKSRHMECIMREVIE